MAARNMEQIAQRAAQSIPKGYDIDSNDIGRLIKLARGADANDTFNCIITAFNYGFAMGNRATVRGRVKRQL